MLSPWQILKLEMHKQPNKRKQTQMIEEIVNFF
jgi:hypothetical protein